MIQMTTNQKTRIHLKAIMKVIKNIFHQQERKSAEPRDHLEHESYSWSLMNYAISKLVLHNLQTFLPDVGFELTGTSLTGFTLAKG